MSHLQRMITRLVSRLWRGLWPQALLALWLVASGTLNILDGLDAETLLQLATDSSGAPLGVEASLGVLGSGGQLMIGSALVLTGFGLLFRVRVAWTFALLLLLMIIGLNGVQRDFGAALIVPALLIAALLCFQGSFNRHTLLGSSLISLVSVVAVVAYGTLGIFLLGEQFEPRISTLLTALYFLIETLTTTGYGDYHPTTAMAQGFMIAVWIFGLGVFGTAVASIAGPALSRRLHRFLSPGVAPRMERNHIILVGSGAMPTNAAHEFVRRGLHFVQIVEADAEPPVADAPVVYGDASDEKTLREARIDRARLLIAAVDDDGDNAFICLAAKEMNPELPVLVTASSQRAIRRLKLARADTVFAPMEVGSRLLVDLVEGDSLPEQFLDLIRTD